MPHVTGSTPPNASGAMAIPRDQWHRTKALPTITVVAYAAVTGVTLYVAGHVQRRISLKGMLLLDRLAGILLTAIAVILLANGFTDLVLARLHR
jgi:multiple antibiotic resistance protein